MLHRLIRYSCIFTACMSPFLNGSFALQRFECGNAVELHNRTMFDFYPNGEMPVCVSIIAILRYIDTQVSRIDIGIE